MHSPEAPDRQPKGGLRASMSAHKGRSIAIITAGIAVIVALAVLVPSAFSKSASPPAPSTTSNATSTTTTAAPASHGALPETHSKVQLGVDLWWLKKDANLTLTDEQKQANKILDYISKVLHANSVTIGFEIFTSSKTSDNVFTTSLTPSPTEIGMVVKAAQADHLRVGIRPLLNIGTTKYIWRGLLVPGDFGTFVTNYYDVLKPYLEVAQADNVPTFDYASEFIALTESSKYTSGWQTLISDMSSVYHHQLVYAESTGQFGQGEHDIVPDLTKYGLHTDAYFGVKGATPSTSEQTLYQTWATQLDRLSVPKLENTVLQEVGFDAQPLGYKAPQTVSSGSTDLKYLFMQKVWFSMICEVVHHYDLTGVYFWNVNFSFNPPKLDGNSTSLGPTIWMNRPGASEIASCFQSFGS